MLIVIAIIAVLLTILAPALRSAKEQATRAVCLGNQMALVKGYIGYCQENKDKMPVGFVIEDFFNEWKVATVYSKVAYPMWANPPHQAREDGWAYLGSHSGPVPTIEDRQRGCETGAIYPYVKNVEAYHCPGDRRLYEGTPRGTSPMYHAYRSYQVPDGMMGQTPFDPGGCIDVEDRYTKLSNIKFPENKYCFVEDEYDLMGANYSYDAWSFEPVIGLYEWWDSVGIFHVDGCTLSFIDGHAAPYKWKDQRSIDYGEDRTITRRDPQPGNPDIEWFVYHYPISTPYRQ